MRSRKNALCIGMAVAGCWLLAAQGLRAADESRYATITITGRLTDPETGKPMVGAVVQFVSTAEEGQKLAGSTDQQGNFTISGLTFGGYVVNITTADGEVIRGVNTVPVSENGPVGILLKISKRARTTTSVENRPERFVAAITEEAPPVNWKRFWREFAAFFGVAAGMGAGI